MVYRRRHAYTFLPGGFHRFQNSQHGSVYGHGDGDYIRLRDEFGNVWRGTATRGDDNLVWYRFRDQHGVTISGISDTYGITLRDDLGHTWRGFVD